jgi:hypothetical protein
MCLYLRLEFICLAVDLNLSGKMLESLHKMILKVVKEVKVVINSLECLFIIPNSGLFLKTVKSQAPLYVSVSTRRLGRKLHDFSLWNTSVYNVSSRHCDEKNTKQNECKKFASPFHPLLVDS